MTTKLDLKEWIVEALKAHGGRAHLIDVAKFIWVNYQDELQHAGDLFFTWQLEVHRAAADLRKEGKLRPKSKSGRGPLELA
jgi:hypothetical protein